MQLVTDVAVLRAVIKEWRTKGETVALVPTMGALHAGHLSLLGLAKARANRGIVTIFVNPKQFGPTEDLDRYPRQEQADQALLQASGCDLVFMPAASAVYPPGFATSVSVATLGDGLEGAARPGHFDGVATVVTKLLTMTLPDIAVFGEKDWQQLAIVRRLVADLDLPVEILGGPIVRDADGLALSSRNAYLSPAQRAQAIALPQTLADTAEALAAGVPVKEALANGVKKLLHAGFASVDYLSLVDARSLEPLVALQPPARLVAAATLGTTRLLDNLAVEQRP